MTSPKLAVANAIVFFQELLPAVQDVRLEEVELHGDPRQWDITLSGLVPAPKKGSSDFSPNVSDLLGLSERVYKKFAVDAVDNQVLSMKIRVIEPQER